jgi:organic hydroperoxide reductase OsmC/OhrA
MAGSKSSWHRRYCRSTGRRINVQTFPHRYVAVAAGGADGEISIESDSLPRLRAAPPMQFGGPGDRWSPETLLVGATVSCFVLTFRAVAKASGLTWTALRCVGDGTLERVGNALQFTRIDLDARLQIAAGTDPLLARRVLEKAERGCLISNSLKAVVHLDIDLDIVDVSARSDPAPTDSLAGP